MSVAVLEVPFDDQFRQQKLVRKWEARFRLPVDGISMIEPLGLAPEQLSRVTIIGEHQAVAQLAAEFAHDWNLGS